jgi:hypothetical protein
LLHIEWKPTKKPKKDTCPCVGCKAVAVVVVVAVVGEEGIITRYKSKSEEEDSNVAGVRERLHTTE